MKRDGKPILSDSSMWQSERWSSAVDSVTAGTPRPRILAHPAFAGLRLFLRGGRYEAVLTTGNFSTLVYGLLCRLLGRRQRQIVAQLYLDERHGLLRWHDAAMRFVLRRASGVLISSAGEAAAVAERFGVPPERIRLVPYHTNVVDPQNFGCASGPVLAAGRNYRDYETLLRAVHDVPVETIIVCGVDQLRDVSLPPHVTVLREIPWEQYLELLRSSSVVVVPLSTEVVPSGQVAALEAMGYGKPVISADSIGMRDYIRDGVDGLLYRVCDVDDLKRCLVALTADGDLRQRMGAAAFERVLGAYTFDLHARAKLQAIAELAGLSLDADPGLGQVPAHN